MSALDLVYNDGLAIHKLSSIKRYTNSSIIIPESVAEHTFYVIYYVFELNSIYAFDLLSAVCYAMTHDFGEIFTSDIPHDIKSKYRELRKILDAIEALELNSTKPYLPSISMGSVEHSIVKLADILSVVLYCKREIELGNNSDRIKTILQESTDRAAHIEYSLKGVLYADK